MVQQDTVEKLFDPRTVSNERIAMMHAALVGFTSPDERLLRRPPKGFSRCPIGEVDEYFEMVAKMGKPYFKWEVIRPAFLWKLELTMSEMLCVEAESLVDGSRDTMISDDELRSQREFIMRKANDFDGCPFTIQRLCELLTTPSRHYKRTDKFLRALEKNINVVTTVTENGERVTGADDFPCAEDERPQHIEQNFFLKVDECDMAIDAKGGGDQSKEESARSVSVKQEPLLIEDASPINLSATNKNTEQPVKQEEDMEVDSNERNGEVKMEQTDEVKEESATEMEENHTTNGECGEETRNAEETAREEEKPAAAPTEMEQ